MVWLLLWLPSEQERGNCNFPSTVRHNSSSYKRGCYHTNSSSRFNDYTQVRNQITRNICWHTLAHLAVKMEWLCCFPLITTEQLRVHFTGTMVKLWVSLYILHLKKKKKHFSLDPIENNAFGLVTFRLEANKFTSTVETWNTSDVPNIEAIRVMGLDKTVTRVTVNGENAKFQTYAQVDTNHDKVLA